VQSFLHAAVRAPTLMFTGRRLTVCGLVEAARPALLAGLGLVSLVSCASAGVSLVSCVTAGVSLVSCVNAGVKANDPATSNATHANNSFFIFSPVWSVRTPPCYPANPRPRLELRQAARPLAATKRASCGRGTSWGVAMPGRAKLKDGLPRKLVPAHPCPRVPADSCMRNRMALFSAHRAAGHIAERPRQTGIAAYSITSSARASSVGGRANGRLGYRPDQREIRGNHTGAEPLGARQLNPLLSGPPVRPLTHIDTRQVGPSLWLVYELQHHFVLWG
jgi:hypothetical protein